MKWKPETDRKVNLDLYCFNRYFISADVSSNTYIDFKFESNEKDP